MSFDYIELKDLLTSKGYMRGPFGSALKRAELKETGVPVYEQQHAIYGIRDFRYFIDDEKYDSLKRFTVRTDDLMISCSGTVGRISIIREDDPKGIISQALLILRPNTDKILTNFLYYFLISQQGQREILNASQGAVQQNLAPKGVVGKILVPIPEIPEQRRIVDILKKIDGKIELNRQTNQTLESIAQAIFKSWFVDFDPVKAKMSVLEAGGSAEDVELAAMAMIVTKSPEELAEFKQTHPKDYKKLAQTAALFPSAMQKSELGEIPEGWEVRALDEIAHYQNGLALQKYRPKGTDFLPVLKISQLKKGFADGKEKASSDIRTECFVNNGDVVFSWSGSLLVDIWCGGKVALNQHLFKVTSDDYPKWLYYYFTKYHLSEFQRIAVDKAVTMGHIKREHLSRAKCVLPDNDDCLIKLGYVIEILLDKQKEQRLESIIFSNLRDSLLPKLLSGELAVEISA
jgi:type I restriction enzyme S subunit